MVATLGLASSQGLCVYQTKTPPFPAQGTEFAPAQLQGPHSVHSLASEPQGGPACTALFTSVGVLVLFCDVPAEPGLEAVYREC